MWSFVMQGAPKLLARVRSGGSGSSLKSSRFHGVCLLPFLDEYCPRIHRLRFHRSSDTVKPKTPSLHVLQSVTPLQYVSLLHGHPVTVVFFTLHGTTFTRSKDNNECQ